jgi:hypothetical protein
MTFKQRLNYCINQMQAAGITNWAGDDNSHITYLCLSQTRCQGAASGWNTPTTNLSTPTGNLHNIKDENAD